MQIGPQSERPQTRLETALALVMALRGKLATLESILEPVILPKPKATTSEAQKPNSSHLPAQLIDSLQDVASCIDRLIDEIAL